MHSNRVPVKKIYSLINTVFLKLGVPIDDAHICTEVLIASDLSGIESHGIGRLKMYYDRIIAGIQNPITKIDVIKDRAAIAVWDGNHGMGQVISHQAMLAAIDKAKEYGVGIITVRNSTHYGIAGYYAKLASDNDMIGITMTNARPSVAPLFGVSPILGTNPIAFSTPTNMDYPFLYDAATSISQRGKIEVLNREGKSTPDIWAIDNSGNPCDDTEELLIELLQKKASLVALGGREEITGGHKGYGLGVIVEILSSALQNGAYLYQLSGLEKDKQVPYKLGHFFMAIDIDSFTDIGSFKKITSDIIKQIKNSKREPEKDNIFIAGEKEYLKEKEVRKIGILINNELRKNLEVMIYELDINFTFDDYN